ncbi:hypothetical protein G9A89_015768 [Geosiphon pyriformis]|nr:hypothetical protein G9A89_015768 [Geosiphon pyriformis]
MAPDFEYLNHQIHIWIAAYQLTETPLETEEKSYQTAPVFNFFSSESDYSTQTVTPEPMVNDSMQQNILIAFQGIQTALEKRNNTPLLLFRGNTQDPIEWLDDFEKAATFQIVGGYLYGSFATWFLQETNANAQQKIIRWAPANVEENNIFFTTWFEIKFKILILISKWCIELEKKTQGPGKVVTKYAKAIRKTKDLFFYKKLKTDLFYAFWSLLVLKNNPTMSMAIELVQQIEDNQKIHLKSTLPVFAPASVMASALQMVATFFVVQTQDPNEQLIDRLTSKQSERINNSKNSDLNPILINSNNPLIKNNKIMAYLDCNNFLLPLPASRNNDNQNNKTINNNVSNQRPNYANINFFGENSLNKSASQPEKNLFYAFNLTDDDHDMDKLAINTSELTRKKKKAKVNFVLNSNKTFKSTVDNNESLKTKVFKNPLKLKLPEIVQKSGPYSAVKDLMKTLAYIIFGQLITHLQFRKNLHKSLIPKKKTLKTNKCLHQAELANNSNVTPLICKAQVAGYFINLILNSESSVNIIAKHFLKAIGRKIDEPSTRPIINIHDDKKKGLGIAKAVPVQINGISIKTNIKVSEAKEYTIIVGNKWLKKAKVLLDYKLCKLIIRCGEKLIIVKYCHWTTLPVPKQSQEKEQLESDDKESKEKDEQKEQEETAELVYTIFTSNNKPLDNVKVDKKRIMVNSKLICWLYYDILRRTFNRKPGKKTKYSYWWHDPCTRCWHDKLLYFSSDKCKFCLIYYKDWKPISLISREKLKEVQKSYENKPPKI